MERFTSGGNNSGVYVTEFGTSQTGELINLLLEWYKDSLKGMEIANGLLKSLRYSPQSPLSDTQRQQLLSGVRRTSRSLKASMENLLDVKDELQRQKETTNS